jgi:alcohol dehydrogenase
MIDTDDGCPEAARRFGATQVVNNCFGNSAKKMIALTDNRGVNVAIEADGISASVDSCQGIARAVRSLTSACMASPSS